MTQTGFCIQYIPIELIRAIVTVADASSLTKGARRLGSQPAVTAQLKRIDQLVGGALFVKTQNGSMPTAMGRLIIEEARRILRSNDQIFRIGGAYNTSPTIRFGMTSTFTRQVLQMFPGAVLKNVALQADNSLAITEAFANGFLDIAFVIENPGMTRELIRGVDATRQKSIVWVRARNFVSAPGQPLPILTWPGNDLIIPTLRDNGLSYTIAFSSPDFQAIRAAAYAGLGLTAWPSRMIPDRLVVDDSSYLPPLKPVETFLLANRAMLNEPAIRMLDLMKTRFFGVQTHSADQPEIAAF